MVYAIVALLVLIFVTLAAYALASPGRKRGRSFGELTPAAVDELALELRATVAGGAAPSRAAYAFAAARAYRRIVAADRAGIALEECEKVFAEKYHTLRARLNRGFGALAALPHTDGEARILTLATAILSSAELCSDADKLQKTLLRFVSRTPLDHAEVVALPLAIEAAGMRLWADVARRLVVLSKSREAAQSDVVPDRRRAKKDGYVYYFVKSGKRVDPRYAEGREFDRGGACVAFAAETAGYAEKTERILALLTTSREALDAEFSASICPGAAAAARDAAFAATDVGSKLAYFAAAATIARRLGTSERAVIEAAVALGEDRGVHFGTYLFDRPDLLRAKLLGKRPKRSHAGRNTVLFASAVFCSSAALGALAAVFSGGVAAGVAVAICCFFAFFPVCDRAARVVAARLCIRRPCPRLTCPRDESCRTELVMPVFLKGEKEARQVADRLLSIAAVNEREFCSYLLLCDFAPSDAEWDGSDDGLLSVLEEYEKRGLKIAVRRRVRERGRWRARDRKRGAIADYNAARMSGCDGAFVKLSPSDGRVRYVIVVDEDDLLAPGAVGEAIDALRHPLAAKYDLLAFGAYADGGRARTAYALDNSGGGVAYAGHSDIFFDLAGTAVFCGKGIYRLDSFARKTAALEGKRLLSHDIAEGAVMNTGAADVAVSEIPPECPSADAARAARWRRGDLMLLPLLGGTVKDRAYAYVILSNAIAALAPIAAFALVAAFFATGSAVLGIAAALAVFASPAARIAESALTSKGRRAAAVLCEAARTVVGAMIDLALLPMRAANCALTALSTALFALFAPHRLCEWKTFASSESESTAAFARVALPGAVLAAVFAAVFWRGFAFSMWAAAYLAAAAAMFSRAFVPTATVRKANERDERRLRKYVARTYEYFKALDGFLPCDNIQIYPPVGHSATVSPTDLGFWLIADVCAAKCGLIAEDEAYENIVSKLTRVVGLPKRSGHLYNWYRRDGSVAPPEYVSFVDSGNFVACAETVRAFCAAMGGEEGERLAAELVEGADFEVFADKKRGLFVRGIDARTGAADGHYDLLASEARLAVAIACARTCSSREWTSLDASRLGALLPTLASWSGTAFEYLMPELFVTAPTGSELCRSARRALFKMRRVRCHGFWGISESGYFAFDKQGNYQYRAHGIDALALSGEGKHKVIAPYASALAATISPHAAAAELSRLEDAGYLGRLGFYEAIDFSCGENVVYSHMTHHQGMILAALTEALAPGAIKSLFAASPRFAAIAMLMSAPKSDCKAVARMRQRFVSCRGAADYRLERTPSEMPSAWAASGGEYRIMLDERGCGFAQFCEARIDVFHGCPESDEGAFGVFIDGEDVVSPTYAPLRKDRGAKAVFTPYGAHYESGACTLDVAVPTGIGGEVRSYRVRNDGASAREYLFVFCRRVALIADGDYRAHPAFNDMFVETEYSDCERVLTARRVPREGAGGMYAALKIEGGADVVPDCDFKHFRDLSEGKYARCTGLGRTLAPCIGFSCKVTVPPGEEAEVKLTLLCAHDRQSLDSKLSALGEGAKLSETRDRGALSKYVEGERGAEIFSDLAARLVFLPMPSKAVRARMSARGRSAEIEEGKRTVIVKYGGTPDFAAYVKACTACALAGADFLMCVLYREEDTYAAPIRRALIEESGISDLERLSFVRLIDVSADGETERGLIAGACVVAGEVYAETFLSGMTAVKSPTLGRRERAPLTPCGAGGFDPSGDYVVERRPKKPYSNVINLPRGGAVVTETGGGFRWSGSAYFGKLNAWFNDAALDPPCEELFALSGGGAVRINRLCEGGYVKHSPGATVFCSRVDDVDWDVKTCVFADGKMTATLVRAVSADERSKNAYWRLMPSLAPHDGRAFCACAARDGVIEAFNCATGEKMYFACVGAKFKCSTDAGASRLSHGLSLGAKTPYPAAAFEIETERERESVFAVVMSADEEALRALTLGDVSSGCRGTEEFFRSLNAVTVDSGERLFDNFFNRWLCTQLYSSRLFGRCGYYQAGGAIGARDILQDALAIIPTDPERAKSVFLDVCAHQYLEGDVMHWWHPPRTGVRTRISDDKLFLPLFAARWVAVTGDASLLEERVPYLSSPPLVGIAEARYETPKPSKEGTVQEHCERAIAHALARKGEHGLLKIGCGDWNDALNAIGTRDRGESVWLTMFAVRVLRDFAAAVGYEKGQRHLKEAESLAAAAAKTFDGEKFARAFTDDGVWLGTGEGNCALDLICQAWAQLAKIGDEDMRRRALDSAAKLYDKEFGLVKLFDPPFEPSDRVGYIGAYPKGVRENGGQYTHAAVWYLIALFDSGRYDEARRLMLDICPSTAAARYGDMRGGEPYVVAADVYSAEGRRGESGWTWYTGSAGWLYTAIVEKALGITMSRGLVRIGKPRGFDAQRLKVTLKIGGTTYKISYQRGDGDYIRSGELNYLNCTEFRPDEKKGSVEVVRIYRGD